MAFEFAQVKIRSYSGADTGVAGTSLVSFEEVAHRAIVPITMSMPIVALVAMLQMSAAFRFGDSSNISSRFTFKNGASCTIFPTL